MAPAIPHFHGAPLFIEAHLIHFRRIDAVAADTWCHPMSRVPTGTLRKRPFYSVFWRARQNKSANTYVLKLLSNGDCSSQMPRPFFSREGSSPEGLRQTFRAFAAIGWVGERSEWSPVAKPRAPKR